MSTGVTTHPEALCNIATAGLNVDTETLTQDEQQLAGLSNLDMHNTKDDSSFSPSLMVNTRA